MKRGFGLLLLIIAGMSSVFGELPDVFYGKCYSKKGELITNEEHQVFKNNGKIEKIRTLYYYPDASKPYAYAESYFKKNYFLPNFYFHHFKGNYVSRSVNLGTTDVILLRRGDTKDYYLEKNYKIERDMVVGHGFYFYMFKYLDDLLKDSGKTIPVHFLIPNKLSKYTFVMSGQIDPNDPNMAILTLKTSNVLGRLFYYTIIVKVDLIKRQLVSYEGPNTFLYGTKKNPFVKIKYSDQKTSKVAESA